MNNDITPWRKASASGGASGGCFEFRRRNARIEIRDSKLGEASPILRMDRAEMLAMMDGVRKGEFDDLLDGVS
jgi:hypothetical protein